MSLADVVPPASDPDRIVIPVRESYYAVAARLGQRPRMEDAYIALPALQDYAASANSSSASSSSSSTNPAWTSSAGIKPCLFGVFDGHASNKQSDDGKIASQSASHLVPQNFVSQLLSGAQVKQALHRAFELTDQAIRMEGAGTTSSVVYLAGQDMYSANVGDSRGIFIKGGKIHELTRDHTPHDPQEAARVEAEGGRLVQHHGLRVMGRLNMTRALGDSELPGVSAIPTIRHFILEGAVEGIIVLASDGLWGVASNEDVAQLVEKEMANGCEAIAKTLVKAAVKGRSSDNTVVLVVDLKQMQSGTATQ